MPDWTEALDCETRDLLRSRSMPRWTDPMLATLTSKRFSSSDWIYERKLDGERCLAFRRRSRVSLLTRNGQALNDTYPELVEALDSQPFEHFIVDGEIVAFEGKLTSFSRLQQRIGIHDARAARSSGVKVYLYLFDLLHLDGYDLTALPLRTRKALLRRHFAFADPVRYTPHRNEDGVAYYQSACRKGWEGVIAKRADASYHHGRSRDWLKFKCVNQQELVIGGFTDPKGKRTGFGALLVGYFEDRDLIYAGKVGTGFDTETLKSLHKRFEEIEQEHSPFANGPSGSDLHWVAPVQVAEIGFTEWTRDGRLRHPRYLGLRHDKNPKDVVRERPR
jgi:bifunctional non-homologous end joining protein LigD